MMRAMRILISGGTIVTATDIYQGDESSGLFVTDPDNRQPVDFAALAAAMKRIGDEQNPPVPHAASLQGALAVLTSGELKQ